MRALTNCFLLIAFTVSFAGCSPSGQTTASTASGSQSQKLPNDALEKIAVEHKTGQLAFYNGTDWSLASIDLQVAAQDANSTQEETRRFRLYPRRTKAGDEARIQPYTTGGVYWEDIATWLQDKKLLKCEIIQAEGFK